MKNKPGLKFLIIRFSAIGDIILTTPLVRTLRKRFPDAEIHFLVKKEFSVLLRNNQHLDKILEFDSKAPHSLADMRRLIKSAAYDRIIDLQVNNRSLLLTLGSGCKQKIKFNHRRIKRFLLVKLKIDRYTKVTPVPLRFIIAAQPWGVLDDGQGLDFFVEPQAVYDVNQALSQFGKLVSKILILAPGAGRATKCWREKGFADAGNHFSRLGYQVILIGGINDKKICSRVFEMLSGEDKINLCGQFSLPQTAALLQRAALVITNDTGIMHLSCALDTPVTAIFGPTTHQLGFFPFRARAWVVEKELACRPCSYHGTAICPEGHFKCMKELESARVIAASEKIINQDFK